MMRSAAFCPRIAASRIQSVMVELARVPSPLTELFEAEPQLRAFIDTAVEPRLRSLGIADVRRDAMGNLAATWGRGESGRSLMLVTNAMNQPASTMPNPYGGEVRDGAAYGLPGEVVLGKGLSEQKAPLAAILVAMEAIAQSGASLSGRLVFLCCVSGETGRHDAIRSIIESHRRARRHGGTQRHRQSDQPRQSRPCRRHRNGPRQPVSQQPAGRGLQRHHRRDRGHAPPDRGGAAATGASASRAGEPDHQSHRQLSRTRLTPFRPVATSASTAGCCPAKTPEAAVADIAAIAKTVDGAKDPASGKAWRVEVTQGPMMYPALVAENSRCRASAVAGLANRARFHA